jgi:hypothetical protein
MTIEGTRKHRHERTGRPTLHPTRWPVGFATKRALRPSGLVLCVLALLGPQRGAAAPQVGKALPELSANDVTGQRQQLTNLIRGPTLLVAIADRDAGDAMRAWFAAAAKRAPQANQVSIISIDKPFFVSDSYARSKARERVPRAYWHASLFDSDRGIAKKLGLGVGTVPYAFAVSGDGRVLASVQGKPDSPNAEQLWGALNRLHSDPLSGRRSAIP